MREEGFVFDADHARRLKQAFDLALERLEVDATDHDVRKRLARTLIRIAKRRAEDSRPEDLAREVVDHACIQSAPHERSPWLATVRQNPSPTVVPWHLLQRLRIRRNETPSV